MKNYTAHPHDMVHVPAKFREITTKAFLSYSAKTKRDGRTDRQTDRRTDRRGALQYLPSRAFGAGGDNKNLNYSETCL